MSASKSQEKRPLKTQERPVQRADREGGASKLFRVLAHKTSVAVGSPVAFLVAFAIVLSWAVAGPIFNFADTWQLVINTGTTIVTFLMVFLIQNTQNRDSRAIHMKLDELILYTRGADNEMVDLENLSDEQMDRLEKHFHSLARSLGREDVADEDEDEEDGMAEEVDEAGSHSTSKTKGSLTHREAHQRRLQRRRERTNASS